MATIACPQSAAQLTRATRCHFCGETLEAGSPVMWYRKGGHRGGSRARGLPERSVACCAREYAGQCEIDRRGAEQAERDKQAADFVASLSALVGAGDIEGAMAALTKATGQ